MAVSKRAVGKNDVSIAPIVSGGSVLGWTIDEKASIRVLDTAPIARRHKRFPIPKLRQGCEFTLTAEDTDALDGSNSCFTA
jgi:hypothetical protein